MKQHDIIIIGAGLAGLSLALRLAPLPVTVLTGPKSDEGGASAWAQGGIAAALSEEDAPLLHAEDTIAAGAGLVDAGRARMLAQNAPAQVKWLEEIGVVFDRKKEGGLALGREAAHSRSRIVHAGGDSTGAAIMRALIATARTTPSITPVFGARALKLKVEEGRIAGVHAAFGGKVEYLPARAIILATGGIGQLFSHTTNPVSACGDGLTLAALAGAGLSDLEFIQFHPTALNIGRDPMPLLTEALRGEGATLINETNLRYMQEEHPQGDLAPRDIVARATWRQLQAGHKPMLDVRHIATPGFAEKFSLIMDVCKGAGLDPAKDPLPIAPAAHYHMGGVKIDDHGRSSIAGLWACGEVACSYIHGANRLASNSLLEALVYGEIVARDVAASLSPPAALSKTKVENIQDSGNEDGKFIGILRHRMYAGLGLVRDKDGMLQTLKEISALAAGGKSSRGMQAKLLVATMMCINALEREESRGAHFRSDFPEISSKAVHSSMTLKHFNASILKYTGQEWQGEK